ncbi:hypothetical protein HIM_11498 [Hirsutella minnesotensis 3608]|uniref:MULE transposase domain-containing protein n=1 Tax=Hirsutella minnesotensis 3608 TaxID=1043627 RepID=A0A0F7ZR72_9HYPO|nr:hypothetical protein HIM_11498 [Hirsutella minnesotensis 3608]
MKAALDSQFPDSQQQICIHHINSNVLLNAKRRWKGVKKDGDSDYSSSSSGQTHIAPTSGDIEAVLSVGDHGDRPLRNDRTMPVTHNYRGVLEMWKYVAFARTKEDYEKAWVRLCEEFNDQQAILTYLYKTYLPVSAQWAYYSIKKYRNFGVRMTSGTEASNNNVKSYLLNGTSHLYGLVEAIEAMLVDQERDFIDNYLGELRIVMSQPGLNLLAKEHRHALRSIPSSSCLWPEPIGNCTDECTVSWQLGIPCRHTIYNKLEAGTFLTKWDVHPRWHLREPTSRNPYRLILDPKIATTLRGRPKNTTEPVPEARAVKRLGRECRGGRAAVGKINTDREPRNKTFALGPGKQTGVRHAGHRRQPSVRRRRSEWETISDDEEPEPPSKRRCRSSRKWPTTSAPTAVSSFGSKENRGDCINVRM